MILKELVKRRAKHASSRCSSETTPRGDGAPLVPEPHTAIQANHVDALLDKATRMVQSSIVVPIVCCFMGLMHASGINRGQFVAAAGLLLPHTILAVLRLLAHELRIHMAA